MIRKVVASHRYKWMTIPGVIGVGIGMFDGEQCIRILVNKKDRIHEEKIPAYTTGYRVVIDEVGEIKAP